MVLYSIPEETQRNTLQDRFDPWYSLPRLPSVPDYLRTSWVQSRVHWTKFPGNWCRHGPRWVVAAVLEQVLDISNALYHTANVPMQAHAERDPEAWYDPAGIQAYHGTSWRCPHPRQPLLHRIHDLPFRSLDRSDHRIGSLWNGNLLRLHIYIHLSHHLLPTHRCLSACQQQFFQELLCMCVPVVHLGDVQQIGNRGCDRVSSGFSNFVCASSVSFIHGALEFPRRGLTCLG